jgi:hypothetical protein
MRDRYRVPGMTPVRTEVTVRGEYSGNVRGDKAIERITYEAGFVCLKDASR